MLRLTSILFGCVFPLAASLALGRIVFWAAAVPWTIVLAAGAPLLSFGVFWLMLFGLAGPTAFVALGAAALVAGLAFAPKLRLGSFHRPPQEAGPVLPWLLMAVLSAYGVLYLVHALAPEIQPDAATYHLGLVAEALRRGGFPPRVGFYEMLPQGLEMLFAFAFAFGGHSAAKLVHFAFLAATLPLIMAVGRQFRVPPAASAAAASFYLLAPVAGVSGTSAYNDAALVFFVLATFWLLSAWREEGKPQQVVCAGLTAGFCYAIKSTGLLIVPLALAFVLLTRSRKAVLLFCGGAALAVAPWLIRNAAVSGNPFAPMFNGLFPNPYFHAESETELRRNLRSYGGITLLQAPRQLTVDGKLHGLVGPLFLLAPLGLLALRRRAGRVFWAAAALLSLPWFFNIGARFLMPSLPFLSLALAMTLPRPALCACLVFHAVTCWPAALSRYAVPQLWSLHGFPWRAALRIEPEQVYLDRNLPEYRLARLLDRKVPAGLRVFDLYGVATAYTRTDTLVYWQSALGERLRRSLQLALYQDQGLLYDLEGRWPRQPFRALRFLQSASLPAYWSIHEALLYCGEERVRNSAGWLLASSHNVWEAPLAFDNNLVSRWSTWQPARPGMSLSVEFDRPVALDRVVLVSDLTENATRVEFQGLDESGRWRLLDARPVVRRRPPVNLRIMATRLLRREGFDYVLVSARPNGIGPLGRSLTEESDTWDVQAVGSVGEVFLFQLR